MKVIDTFTRDAMGLEETGRALWLRLGLRPPLRSVLLHWTGRPEPAHVIALQELTR